MSKSPGQRLGRQQYFKYVDLSIDEVNALAESFSAEDREALAKAHMPMVYKIVDQFCRNDPSLDRDDATGAACLGMATALSSWEAREAGWGHITGWIQMRALAYLLNLYNRSHVPGRAQVPVGTPYAGSREANAESDLAAESMLEGLSPEERTVVELYALGDNSLPEIARRLGITPRKARRVWERARDSMMEALGEPA